MWSVYPRFEVDEDAGIITQSEVATATQVMGAEQEPTDEERTEPDGLGGDGSGAILAYRGWRTR